MADDARPDLALATAQPRFVQSTWFGPSPHVDEEQLLHEGADPFGFTRIWKAFMSARVLLALAILALMVSAHRLSQPLPVWLFGVCGAYLLATVAARLLARPCGPGPAFDAQWIYIVGLDLFCVGFLLSVRITSLHYAPLLALPVLMAAVLGSRALALGTAVLAALVALGDTAIGASDSLWAGAADWVQAGLVGVGLVALAWLTNTLSLRLAREQLHAWRSQAEARTQSLVNNLVIETLGDGVLVVDSHDVVRAANPAARQMLGSDDEVIPHVFNLRDHPVWSRLVEIARWGLAGETVADVDVTLHHERRAASRLRVRTERTPSMGIDGPTLCVMFLQDQRENEVRLRTEKLASLGRMSAAVAHEIRNPLAAIVQANALLQEELEQPTQQQLSTMIGQNAERLAHIVDDVLDVSRSQDQIAPTQLLPFDEEVGRFCAEWAAQKQVEVRLIMDLQAPGARIRFLHEHLRRLLVNLLDNGMRYASQKPGAIQVVTQAVEHGPAVLLVWSDGAPLDPAVEDHLFEPFSSSEARSSGLGLFICRELCERHGAAIGYERSLREQAGRAVEGNGFFVHFHRTADVPDAEHMLPVPSS